MTLLKIEQIIGNNNKFGIEVILLPYKSDKNLQFVSFFSVSKFVFGNFSDSLNKSQGLRKINSEILEIFENIPLQCLRSEH